MGGDVGASVVVPGAAISLSRHPDTEFLLFGDRARIEPELERHPALKAASRVFHTDVAVSANDKPSQALRRGRKTSSMWLAIDAVKKGEAGVAVSAGNTGALMAMARFNLHTLPGIDRPAIAGIWPTLRGDSIVLDLGASIGGDAQHLVALAMMGGAMASVLFNTERPTIGLLNIGVEEMKGHEEIREAAEQLRAANLPQLNYVGFVEGDGIGKGLADVVVTEGFWQHRAQGGGGDRAANGRTPAYLHKKELAIAHRLSVRPQCFPGAAREDGSQQIQWRRAARVAGCRR